MAESKFTLNPFKNQKKQPLTTFTPPRTAQTSYQTTPQEMVQRQTAFRKSFGNLGANILQATGKPIQKVAPDSQYSQQFVGSGGLIQPSTTVPGSKRGGSTTKAPAFDNEAALAGLRKQAVEQNAFYEAQQIAPGESEITGGEVASEVASEVTSEVTSDGTGTTGPGAGGYTPPGFSKMEEGQQGVDTGQPSPGGVQTQPFTQPGGVGAIGAGGMSGTAGGIPKSKFEQGFNAANAALGTSGGAPGGIPTSQGASLVQQYAPTKSNSIASTFVQTDPFIEGLVTAWQQYINPANQRKSLSDTYNQMLKDSGVQALDMELLNMKNVIEGSEDDLRTEITKAGGFATESQILGLTNARNKQLIRNYNTLLDTRNAKEKYLQTAIQLEESDRNSADRRFESAFSMGLQIADYQQKMQTNARSQMQWLTQNLGFDGLYDATGGDPFTMGLVEQTLGLPQGGLLGAANQARLARAQVGEEQELDLELKRAQIEKINYEMNNPGVETQVVETGGKKYLIDSNTGETIKEIAGGMETVNTQQQLAQDQAQIQQIGDILTSGNLNTAVGPNIFSRFGRFRNILRPGAPNFIASVEQLTSQLNLESLIEAKSRGATFGALSDQELRVLSSAATKIGSWAVKDKKGNITGYKVKEKDFKKELDKINNFAKLDYILKGGNPGDVGIQQINGRWVTPNSDGSGQDFTDDINRFKSAGNASASKIASAIKKVESGGNYNARGGSGEFGAYQFMPGTWKSWAGKYLGNSNAQPTPANQDKVMMARVNDLLKQGYNAQQIALIHNGGQPIVKRGVNKFGVRYDSGAYAKKVLRELS